MYNNNHSFHLSLSLSLSFIPSISFVFDNGYTNSLSSLYLAHIPLSPISLTAGIGDIIEGTRAVSLSTGSNTPY